MRFAVLIAGVGVAVLAVACGEASDSLTLEEYFAEFEAIDSDVDAQFEEAFTQLFPEDVDEESFFTDDTNLPLVKEAIAAFPRITSEIHDRANELDPPSEVEAEHNEMVAALEELASAFEEGVTRLEDAETFSEFQVVNDELDATLLEPAQQRVEQACLDVVAVGESNGINVAAITCVDG